MGPKESSLKIAWYRCDIWNDANSLKTCHCCTSLEKVCQPVAGEGSLSLNAELSVEFHTLWRVYVVIKIHLALLCLGKTKINSSFVPHLWFMLAKSGRAPSGFSRLLSQTFSCSSAAEHRTISKCCSYSLTDIKFVVKEASHYISLYNMSFKIFCAQVSM